MVQLSRKTFEDFVGNMADDAKQVLDDILERDGTTRRGRTVAATTTPVAGSVVDAAPLAAADDLRDGAGVTESLATLPDQIAELSRLISTLLPALEGLSAAVGTLGASSAAGAVGKAAATKKGR